MTLAAYTFYDRDISIKGIPTSDEVEFNIDLTDHSYFIIDRNDVLELAAHFNITQEEIEGVQSYPKV